MSKLVSFLILLPFLGLAQVNLVPNYSFELNNGCYNGGGGVSQVVNYWKIYSYNSVDYFHPCNNTNPSPNYGVPYNVFGFQNAKEGIAYACINTFCFCSELSRDYLVVELSDSITKGIPYLVNFYINLTNKSQYTHTSIGAYLSFVPPDFTPTNLYTQTPQILNNPENQFNDTSAWILVTDTFISNFGGEKYLSIGNFFNDSNTDTISIGDGINFSNRTDFFVDDVWVTPLDTSIGIEEEEQIKFSVYPNPNNGEFIVQLKGQPAKTVSVSLCDLQGRKVFEEHIQTQEKEIEIKASELSSGIYTLQVTVDSGYSSWQKIVISP